MGKNWPDCAYCRKTLIEPDYSQLCGVWWLCIECKKYLDTYETKTRIIVKENIEHGSIRNKK